MADDWPWTVRTSTLYLILTSGIVFAGLVAWITVADDNDMKVIANTVNLGGTLLTFAGLSYAYLRANSQIRAWFQRMWARLTGKPIIHRVDANSVVNIDSTATLTLGFGFNDADDRTEQLLGFVNRLSAMISAAEERIHDLGKAVEHAKAEARSGDDQTRAEAEAALRQFSQDLNKSQVLDLRWAIAGVFFSTFGAVLSFWT